jgi:hypothetical protein
MAPVLAPVQTVQRLLRWRLGAAERAHREGIALRMVSKQKPRGPSTSAKALFCLLLCGDCGWHRNCDALAARNRKAVMDFTPTTPQRKTEHPARFRWMQRHGHGSRRDRGQP